MIIESLAVVQAQLAKKLSETESFSTLQTDGTTKFGEHFATYDVRVNEAQDTYTLGVRHVFSGTAKNTLETLQEILDDIDSVQLSLGNECASAKIIAKIKNTMSDRHSAEKLFNRLLEEFREGVLPSISENWNDLTTVEKDQIVCMNNFFCGLHFVVGLADTAEEVLKKWESQSFSTTVSGSSGTQRLVRTACKAFHHKGSQQAGCSTSFRSYLRKLQINKIPLAHFVGNRFNILFYDAGGVYFLREHMKEFIEKTYGKTANRLLLAVLSDLRNPIYISGIRALGLIDKIVTGPLWRKLQESSISVLKMSDVYSDLKEKCDKWSGNAQDVVDGSARLECASNVHIDNVWDALVLSDSDITDVQTQELLQLLFAAFSITTERMLFDHLPGGQYHKDNVDGSDLVKETASVPTTNVSPERDFAVLYRILREKPNATIIALESFILYSHNKTTKWLQQQSGDDREKLLKMARTLAPTIREKFKLRTIAIKEQQEELVMKKQQEIAQKETRLIKEKEKLTKDIESVRLWLTRADVRKGLETVKSKTGVTRLLKLQINFRRKVLGQTYEDLSVFRFSESGKNFSNDQLKDNLHCLVPTERNDCPVKPSLEAILSEPQLLVNQRIKHRFEEDGQMIWYLGTVEDFCAETMSFTVMRKKLVTFHCLMTLKLVIF